MLNVTVEHFKLFWPGHVFESKSTVSYRFLERTPGECSSILSVDTVPSDGHQVTLGCHDITQQSQVTIVNVGTVEGDNVVHLSLNSFTHSLNTKSLKKDTNWSKFNNLIRSPLEIGVDYSKI